jgi:protein phosphatase 4 regulatory subunit 3
MLLETKIQKDDGYQKQQDTLIVWTESNGTDMALSFQEAEGCAVIW